MTAILILKKNTPLAPLKGGIFRLNYRGIFMNSPFGIPPLKGDKGDVTQNCKKKMP